MQNLKTYLSIALLCTLLSAAVSIYACYKIWYKPAPPPVAKEEKKEEEKRIGTIKKFAPPAVKGDPPILLSEESYVSEIKSESKSVYEKQDNLLFSTNHKFKSLMMDIRLDQIPLIEKIAPKNTWTGLEYNFKDSELLYKIGYSTRIF